MKDFFISYNKADKAWAEWIAWILEEAGFFVVIQAWDFRPGENFVLKMHEAAAGTRQTIAILSADYLNAEYTHPEWAAAFEQDPQGKHRILIPIRVKSCEPKGLLASIIHIDVIGLSEDQARKAVFEGLEERGKPADAPTFPAAKQTQQSDTERLMKNPVEYPGLQKHANGSDNAGIPSNLPTGIPFFTGREDILTRLHDALKASGSTALTQRQAISGLGGIGKTQTAIEYARRHRDEYTALLWAVADSKESLIAHFVAIAGLLGLPEANVQDQTFTVKMVKRWFETNRGWLLILDNADDPKILEEFLPESSTGNVILTSRAQVFDNLGILNPVELEEMTPSDAKEFLLKRTGRHDLPMQEIQAVEKLAQELDYLPLALEQAGAYIKELRGSFQDYLISYQKRGLELLEKGFSGGKYRKSVRTTWSLNFQQVEQSSKPSADLLRVSAFLHPDRIPAELIIQGAPDLGPELAAALIDVNVDPLALDELIGPLIRYSLIHRDRESRTYDIHRLVQAVLKDGMDESTRQLWAERVVKAFASVFPEVDQNNPSQWDLIERLLAHAQACSELVEGYKIEFQEAGKLLDLCGRYIHFRGRLSEAEPFYESSLTIREKHFEADHPDIATSLHNRAWLYYDQGKYAQAEPLLLRALKTREETFGVNHGEVAKTLTLLARLYLWLGRITEGERCAQRALEIREKALGKDHPETADSLSDLVDIFIERGYDLQAEELVSRVLEIRKRAFGPEHHKLAFSLRELAVIYMHQNREAEAETLLLEAIRLYEKAFGSNYPRMADLLHTLGNLYAEQARFEESERLLNRALEIIEPALGVDHPSVGMYLRSLAHTYRRQKRYREAESFYTRAVAKNEASLGSNNPELAYSLAGLGRLYYDQKKYFRGEPLLRRSVQILTRVLGQQNPRVADAMFLHAALLKGMNRKGEGQKLEAQARKIQFSLNKKKSRK